MNDMYIASYRVKPLVVVSTRWCGNLFDMNMCCSKTNTPAIFDQWWCTRGHGIGIYADMSTTHIRRLELQKRLTSVVTICVMDINGTVPDYIWEVWHRHTMRQTESNSTNTWRPKQNSHNLANDTFKSTLLQNADVLMIDISQTFSGVELTICHHRLIYWLAAYWSKSHD